MKQDDKYIVWGMLWRMCQLGIFTIYEVDEIRMGLGDKEDVWIHG